MTLAQPLHRISTAHARGYGAALTRLTVAVVGLLLAAAPAAAIVITNGPTYSPGSGWSCTAPAAGLEKLSGGGNYVCNGTAGAFTNLYLGVNRSTASPFGDNMASASAEPSGNERFIWTQNGSTFIRYSGQTSMAGFGLVDTRVTLTFSGTGAVVTDATTQALLGAQIRGSGGVNTAPGVNSLWRIGASVSSMNVNVLIEAGDAGSGIWQPASTYFGTTTTHRQGDGVSEVDRSHVDLAFYTSTCGDAQVDGTESCDLGGSNGTATSCCTATCGFRTSGSVCRTSAGVCDVQETCTGSSGTCPANGFASSALQCRSSAGVCDPAENCTGSGVACPADILSPSTTVCRSSAGVCDPAENCTGSSAPCPADAIAPSTTVCRSVAGVCDVAENCDGSSVDCPADAFEAPTVECRSTAGVCDVAESCTGSAADCPTDTFEPASVECRGSAGVCDVAESCTGSAADCPSDAFEPATVECRALAGVCDVAESCTGSDAACPADALEPATVECRGSAGVCDVAESCDGANAACPTDAFQPSTLVCRPDAGQCDVEESCTGSQADCPAEGFEPNGTTCDDGVTCTVADACDAGVCAGNPMTCGDGVIQGSCAEVCDDGNTDPDDGCSPTCQIEAGLACSDGPMTGCRTPWVPRKSSLQLSNRTPDLKDSVKFKWSKGNRTTVAELGTPLTTTNYQLCIFDQTGLRIEVTYPAGGTCAGKPCWKPTGVKGFNYKDKELTPDGGQSLKLKEGAVGKAQIQLQGRGAALGLPDLTSLAQPITVQIQNSNGLCWEAVFSGPPSKQTAEQFKDIAD